MKGKLILTAALSLSCALGAFGLSACGDGSTNTNKPPVQSHVHDWKTEYDKDGEKHWIECNGCDEIKDEALHDFTNGDCVCGQPAPVQPHVHDWKTEYDKDGEKHWIECNGCDEIKDEAPHDFTNGDCVCGQPKPAEPVTDTEGLEYERISGSSNYAVVGAGTAVDATQIVIPKRYRGQRVVSIGKSAFSKCKFLKSVIMQDGMLTTIEEGAFYNCSALESVIVPDSVTSIDYTAFNPNGNCFNVHGNGKYLGNEANPYRFLFTGKNADITSLEIHGDTKIIVKNAFAYYASLAAVNMGNGVETMGSGAFMGCANLETVIFSNQLKYVDFDTFKGCAKLKSVALPASVGGTIGDNAFENCSSMTSVIISDAVREIESSAFRGCSKLESIVLPSYVKIHLFAFHECDALTSLYFKGTPSEWLKMDIDSNGNAPLTSAHRFYYSETSEAGKWHFDGNGNPVKW